MGLLDTLKKIFTRHHEKDFYRETLGRLQVKDKGEFKLVSYERDGVFDYETYRQVQTEGNKRKLTSVFVQEDVIRGIAQYANARGPVRRVLCHGTRNAAEQRYFRAALPDLVEVLGTEISETATQFPDTIQWDFHDMNEAWRGHFDLVYSNSWDHSYDPEKLFRVWADCVAPGGWMALEHTSRHEPGAVNALDPFGISQDGLKRLVAEQTGMTCETTLVFDGKRARHILMFAKA